MRIVCAGRVGKSAKTNAISTLAGLSYAVPHHWTAKTHVNAARGPSGARRVFNRKEAGGQGAFAPPYFYYRALARLRRRVADDLVNVFGCPSTVRPRPSRRCMVSPSSATASRRPALPSRPSEAPVIGSPCHVRPCAAPVVSCRRNPRGAVTGRSDLRHGQDTFPHRLCSAGLQQSP